MKRYKELKDEMKQEPHGFKPTDEKEEELPHEFKPMYETEEQSKFGCLISGVVVVLTIIGIIIQLIR